MRHLKNLSLSIISAVLLVLSFPPYNLSLLAYIALVPLYFTAFEKDNPFKPLWFSITGFLYYSLLLKWTMQFHYLSVPFISLVSGFLFFTLPLWMSVKLMGGAKSIRGLIIVPSIWIIAEFLKTRGPLSFAFGILGYSQHNNLTLIQMADITGVFGISFMIILFNYLIYYLLSQMNTVETAWDGPQQVNSVKSEGGLIGRFLSIMKGLKNTGIKKERAIPVISGVIIISLILLYGKIKLNQESVEEDLNIRIIQTDHDHKVPWMEKMDVYLNEYAGKLSSAREREIDLYLLPENSVKTFLSLNRNFQPPDSTEILNQISAMARDNGTALLFGGLEAEPENSAINKYNAAFLFDRMGNLTGRYRKRILVPFGETDPFGGYLPLVDKILLGDTGAIRLSRGTKNKIMKVHNKKNREYRFGVAICFESTDGALLRENSKNKADFIINITSDRWTESNTALHQHAIFGVFRAVENRLSYYRAGNGGISRIIDPHGKIIDEIPSFKEGIITGKLYKLKNWGETIYVTFGDWIVLSAFIIVILSIIGRIRKKK